MILWLQCSLVTYLIIQLPAFSFKSDKDGGESVCPVCLCLPKSGRIGAFAGVSHEKAPVLVALVASIVMFLAYCGED
jgi:hypothetical protein